MNDPDGKHLNRALYYVYTDDPYDVIDGMFLIAGLTEDDFGDIPDELIETYEELFHQPEKFDLVTDQYGRKHIVVTPCEPEEGAK